MITAEQRIERRKHLGSSDCAAVLGLDPFRSAWDIWAEKTGKDEGFAGNAATDRGNDLEPAILSWAERELSAPLIRDVHCPDKLGTILAANLDADCPQLDAIVEAKSSVNADEWGEPYTDQVPDRVVIQTHVAMFCAGRRMAYVPVLTPGFKRFDFRMYQIPYKPELAQVIAERAEAFWMNHVMADVPPEGSFGSAEVLKRIRREPGKIVEVSDELVSAWDALRTMRLQAEKQEAEAERTLLTAIGDAEAARWSGGIVTYMETVQNIKAKEACIRRFRSLRMKRAKEMVTA